MLPEERQPQVILIIFTYLYIEDSEEPVNFHLLSYLQSFAFILTFPAIFSCSS